MKLRHLNSFILTGIALFVVGVIGLARGNGFLTEPGLPINRWAAVEYFVAAILMLINGVVSIRLARDGEGKAAQVAEPRVSASEGNTPTE